MANLPESPVYDAGVYQLETTDAVVGGAGGKSNAAAINLANRTAYLKQHVDALEAALAAEAGSVAFFAKNTAPTGWLKANGALVSRTTYAALFAAIGTTFGVGDGSTTFALPDLRGEFLRGWDDGRGVDSGRGFGSKQIDSVKKHSHLLPTSTSDTSSPEWTITDTLWTFSTPNSSPADYSPVAKTLDTTPYNDPSLGPESRPRNVALLACIKY